MNLKQLPLLMTPGPTQVRENVRHARSVEMTNPDLDPSFFKFYKETCGCLSDFLHTRNPVLILGGEGMLGLDAACVSLIEPGDRVLVIENGLFGEGFSDLVRLYGAVPVLFRGDRKREIDVAALESFLKKDSDFKLATIVHCDTPSGVLNELDKICPLLKSFGILTVVDAVSSMVGEEIFVDLWKIDICIGASQKGFSAPPGLTFLSISPDAYGVMESRKTPIASFYGNLWIWKNYEQEFWFPYSPPASDIYGFSVAVSNVLEEDRIVFRHQSIAKAVRSAILKTGLSLHLKSGYCATVTVMDVPGELDAEQLVRQILDEENVLIGGCFGYLKGKVIRIGHMGENARSDFVAKALFSIQKVLERNGIHLKEDMRTVFLEELEKECDEFKKK
ncbi:alanine--glyoxylate aminotransferase family protein [Methanolapillus ohkumae]|uniref:Pyridoxamine--pyruvate transaminase n=1 Tax=Methanolapillus ohkumae TaxID=3028298 RepID=A0AA96V574_9EURY|nr:Pyridoxamine--pyruvate transaminase [Methanosarcinaceae archaeon Am2]